LVVEAAPHRQSRPQESARALDQPAYVLTESDPVKPAPFRYHAPRTVDEAVAQLAELSPHDGRVLAGGQSLVPMMAFRMARPAHLIDINNAVGLDRLAADGNTLSIAACVRHAAFHRPVVSGPTGALLSNVVANIAHYPIRLRGTFCGSLAHADPASEWCLTAVTLGAEIVVLSSRGRRVIAADDFFEGMMMTALAEDELLSEARLPLLAPDTRFGFYEFSRRAGDYAIAMALATFRLQDGVIAEPRLGVGGAEGRPRRMAQAEAVLVGQKPGDEAFRAAAEAAAAAIDPLEDVHADAEFRLDLVRAVTRRALERAAA
jgi:carbon-monoxide dehydrogenase medium subunit